MGCSFDALALYFPTFLSKLSAVISMWELLATWLRFSLQKCMLAARKIYPLTFSSHFLWKAQVSFSLTVKNVWRGKGEWTSSLCKTSRVVLFSSSTPNFSQSSSCIMQCALRKEIWQQKQMQTLSLVLKDLFLSIRGQSPSAGSFFFIAVSWIWP